MKVIEDLVSDTFLLVYGGIGLIVIIFLTYGLLRLNRWAREDAERDHDL